MSGLVVTDKSSAVNLSSLAAPVTVGGSYQYGTFSVIANVVGSTAAAIALLNAGGGSNTGVGLDFYTTTGNAGIAQGRISGVDDGAYSTHLVFSTKQQGAAGNPLTERMRLTSTGSLGIGTATPQHTLDVNGDLKSASFLTGANGNFQVASGGLGYTVLTFNGNNNDGSRIGFEGGGGSDPNLYIDIPAGGKFCFRIGGDATSGYIDANGFHVGAPS